MVQEKQDSPITEFSIPQTQSYPVGVTVDSKGNVWFAESNTDMIVRFNPTNQSFTSFKIPTSSHVATIWFMCFDNKGLLWFADPTEPALWRFSPSDESFANFTTGSPNIEPYGLVYEPNINQLWFTSPFSNQIGYFEINPDESVTLGGIVNVPTGGRTGYGGPFGISEDSLGDLFLSQPTLGEIVEYNVMSHSFLHSWQFPYGTQPTGLSPESSDGRVWFTNHASSLFGYVNISTGDYVQFSTSYFVENSSLGGPTISLPYWMQSSSSGEIWFNEHFSNKIAEFDPSTLTLVEFTVPTAGSEPLRFAIDDTRGLVWFTEFSGNKIGFLDQNVSSLRNSEETLASKKVVSLGQLGNAQLTLDVPDGALDNNSFTGSLSFNGILSNNLTISVENLNSTASTISIQSHRNLDPGNYSITICPKSLNSSSTPIQSCVIILLVVERGLSSYTNDLIYFAAAIALLSAAVVSIYYIRRWK